MIATASCSTDHGAASQLFLSLINTLMTAQCAITTKYPASISDTLKNGDVFDYIVVGAGSAGSIVASRLSENPNVTVLLLEAGTFPSMDTEIPGMMFSNYAGPENWAYKTQPNKNSCLGLKEKRCSCPRGKTIGGSSAVNALLYLRGNEDDYNYWAKENPGWEHSSVIEYFKKHEKIITELPKSTNKYCGNSTLALNQIKSKHPLRKVLINAAKELGYDHFDKEVPLGYFDALNNIENGLRCSASKAFLIKPRKNLFIATNAQVGRVLTTSYPSKAYGVEVKIGNKTLIVKASAEVVLSGGTINSPQILMNSGIGPRKHLESLNIPVVKDLNVGGNLQDHPEFLGMLFKINHTLLQPYELLDEAYKLLKHQDSLLGSVDMLTYMGFIDSKNTSSGTADVLLHHLLIFQNDHANFKLLSDSLRLEDATVESLQKELQTSSLLWFLPILKYPQSRGSITLNSSNPYDYPLIHHEYVSDKNNEDFSAYMRVVEYGKKLAETESFKKNNVKLIKMYIKDCSHLEKDEEFYACAIRHVVTTIYHPVGTCKMGPSTDKKAVVDSKLRVHGVDRLRVIDASIMPRITSCNINGPTMMIAKKGVDFIKETWK